MLPAWPVGVTYTKGLLGVDQRATVAESLKQARLERSAWTKRIETESFGSRFESDPKLMMIVRETGRALFGDNCAACHGADARGGKGFPNLTTTSWLWGGTPEALAETIRAGSIHHTPRAAPRRCPPLGAIRMCRAPTSRMSSAMCGHSRSCRVKGGAGREA